MRSCALSIFGANVIGQFNHFGEFRAIEGRLHANPNQRREYTFRGNIADQFVAGKGAATQTGKCGIEAAAASRVGGQNLIFRIVGAGVQMNTQFDACDVILHLRVETVDQVGSGCAYSVGQ
jgi:hypothetical protein